MRNAVLKYEKDEAEITLKELQFQLLAMIIVEI